MNYFRIFKNPVSIIKTVIILIALQKNIKQQSLSFLRNAQPRIDNPFLNHYHRKSNTVHCYVSAKTSFFTIMLEMDEL